MPLQQVCSDVGQPTPQQRMGAKKKRGTKSRSLSRQDRKFVLALQQELNRNKPRIARPNKEMKDRANSDPSEGEEEDALRSSPENPVAPEARSLTEQELVQLLLSLQHVGP